MKKMKNSSFVKYDIDNRLCIMLPSEVNTNWCEFDTPNIKFDTKNKKVIIELDYKEYKRDEQK